MLAIVRMSSAFPWCLLSMAHCLIPRCHIQLLHGVNHSGMGAQSQQAIGHKVHTHLAARVKDG